jgi:periplasmic protein TorT
MRNALSAILMAALGGVAQAEDWQLEARAVPFDDASAAVPLTYTPLGHAARPWRFCVLYPHLKDAYWLSVNYGMVEEARRLGVAFDVYEAGGYPNLSRQIEQLKGCASEEFDAVILGAVSYSGLTAEVERIARLKPVIAAVNDIDDSGITAKASVPWTEMGAAAGRFLAERHPKGSPPVSVAWFPGPQGAGWVTFVEAGFREALAESSAQIVLTRFGDTGTEEQVLLVEEVLEAMPDVDYLVGSGPMAEAAVPILRARGLEGKVKVVSTYLSHAVYRGVVRGRILAAPTDSPVLQGRLSIEMAVRALEDRLTTRHAGPPVWTVTPATAGNGVIEGSLAPASFVPVFSLEASILPGANN